MEYWWNELIKKFNCRIEKTSGSEELDEFDIARICKTGAELAIYDYHSEPYEGYGELLLYKGKKWYRHNLGHCSCYGPTEEEHLEESMKRPIASNLNQLEKKVTEDLANDLAKNICIAKKLGYK